MNRWILLCLFIYGCASSSKTSIRNLNQPAIIYRLPKSVTELLAKKIKGHDDSLYFELSRDSNSFSIELQEIDHVVDHRWLLASNRKVKIGKRLFPLLMDYDRTYGIKETPTELVILAKSDKDFMYTMELMTGEPYYVKFDPSGKILYAGR